MIRVVCDCGRVFKAEQRHAGKRTRCPACGASLVIGKLSSSGSGEMDLAEVPSWWYPSFPAESMGMDKDQPGENEDPESVRTTILEPGSGMEGGEPVAHPPGGGPAPTPSPGPGRSLWTVGGAIAAGSLLVLAVLCWIGGTVPLPGGAAAARVPRAGKLPPDLGRGPGPFGNPDRNPAAAVDEGWPIGPDLGAELARPGRLARRLRLLVPAYIYPKGDGRLQWRRLIDAAAKVDLVAVVNPENGPGVERNSDYAAVIAEAADRGVKLVGYVNTQYAARPVSEVKGDVDLWIRFYPRIVGFFFDQQPTDPRHAAYIAEIGNYARGKIKDCFVVTNPGVPCDQAYLARRASDLVAIFADSDQFATFELPANLKEFGPNRFAALVYQIADADTMRSLLKEAIIKRIGWVLVTDGKLPNPWVRLPSYWDAEIEALTHLQ